VDAQYLNPFIIAMKNVFKTMLSVDIAMGKPSVKTDYVTNADVTGLLPLSGGKTGFVRLCLSEKAALFIYKSLLFEEASEINGDVLDAVGEVANIVAGQARNELKLASLDANIEPPVIITGQGLEQYPAVKLPLICLPLTFQADESQETISADFAIS
jgi:chemotaxis protein CheX